MSNHKKSILKLLGLSAFLLISNISPSIAATTRQLIPNDQNHLLLTQTTQQNPKSFLNQGRIKFESGQFTEAADIWQQAANDFQQQGDKLNQALSLSYIKTLVFILDGSLRNLPMASLYDGKQYLMSKYNIALSPEMKLMRSGSVSKRESQSIKPERLKAIIAGLSEAR